jgi:quinohemoprotein ethanol dehydrogenase
MRRSNMRRLLLFIVAAGLAAVTAVALASAEPTSSGSAAASFLPSGLTPAGDNWLVGEGDLAGSRFSTLTQINASNVQNLKVDWNAQFDSPAITGGGGLGSDGPESEPICCVNGMMYLAYTTGLVALDPATGSILWNYQGSYNPVATQLHAGAAQPPGDANTNARIESYNPALNYIYVGQQDGSIVALNAKTGAPVWTVNVQGTGTYGESAGAESVPFAEYYAVPGADGIVLSAPNGGESPFRGHLDAYDAKTGALLWRVWNTPDPTQLPYILSWGNPAEAATAGAAVWSVPAVDPQLGMVFYGTGNPYPETGRQPGDDLWTESIMAVNWKTGALDWYFQTTHHDEFDLDLPHPPMVLNVPINGKMTTIVAEGSKSGYFFVRNAKNGGPVPNFKITNTPVYDPSGQGVALNNLSSVQPVPQGAAGCMVIMDYSAAGLSTCGFPANTIATEYGGTNNVNVQSGGSVVNAANGIPIVGTPFMAAPTPAAYFVFGGAGGGGNFGYPPSSYDPDTHDYYACLQNQSGGHSNTNTLGPTQTTALGVSALGSQGITGFYDAIDMETNTMAWQYESMASGNGDCYSGSLSTAGNLAFTAFKGESDLATCATITPACAAAGVTTPGTPALKVLLSPTNSTPGGNFDAFNATTGQILWTWGIPFDSFGAPAVTYMYKGVQYIAIYHLVAAPGNPGATATGQRDELTVFSLY